MELSKANLQDAEISIDDVYSTFNHHIKLEENNRIIFSGAYGTGKTFFLKKYFENNEEFNTVVISPINYVVNKNEDIFELIKADIIFKLFEKELIVFDEDFEFDNFSAFTWYLFKNPFEIVKTLLPYIDKVDSIGEELGDQIKVGQKIIETVTSNYKKFKNKFENEINESNNTLDQFFKKLEKQKGSPYERDLVTQFINDVLLNLSKTKASVLVIDDLDRLDPDHIFRILNILSVHNNCLGAENKFGFEKIILVCDIDNIENIFNYRYGPDVDFNGYIDKFYSTRIYPFSNKEAVKLFCREHIRQNRLPKHCENLFLLLILDLLEKEKITLRNLLKYRFDLERNTLSISENITIDKSKYCRNCCFINTDKFLIDSTDFPFVHILGVLINIFGDFKKLKNCFIELSKILGYDIPHLNIDDVLVSLGALAHISKSEEKANVICFNIDKNKRGHGTHINNPSIQFLNKGMEIKLIWDSNNKYKGDVSYFRGHSIGYKPPLNQIAFNLIYKELVLIMRYFEKKNFINQI